MNAKKLLLVNKKDSLKYKTSDYPLANNSNFDRNRVKGVQLRFGGGAFSMLGGAVLDLRGCITLPVRTAINRRR